MKSRIPSYYQLLIGLTVGLLVGFRPVQTGKLDGAWRLSDPSGAMVTLTIADNYLMQTTYEPDRYISTRGGTCRQSDGTLTLLVEFDTKDSSRVGQSETYQLAVSSNQLRINNASGSQTFSRIEETPTSLTGLWRITGRANDAGQLVTMQRGPRKTIKLLTGSRFQWAAINPQTKQFFGTGGGTYTLTDGKYTETIDFFSRDNSRVGRSLTFGADVQPNEWHHTGQSSTGGRVNEVWSREK
ncbi:membrane or secreted protein [Spirosoma sp. KNUC1025]|uniref:membrane or secreted protein n=1 Tax=Spirosoma sp. KNUC1025 TaxID=2894082 RepID=UPI003865168D|nr:membrane or secreted protein [Spirosoma sp. KNUC1025]